MVPNVSIIVPIYNGELYIKKCIESLLEQTLQNIEIILIDDGSTDNSKEIIDSYSKLDKRIKSIFQKNSGPSTARNIGIKNATGEYITFVDADDWVNKETYSELYDRASENNVDVAFCALYYEYPDDITKNFISNYPIKSNVILNVSVNSSSQNSR